MTLDSLIHHKSEIARARATFVTAHTSKQHVTDVLHLDIPTSTLYGKSLLLKSDLSGHFYMVLPQRKGE